jgi:hypothetical protein
MSDDTPVAKDPPRAPCYEYQNDHISAEEFFERIDAVPKEDLRALIEEWRESEEHMASQGVDEWADGIKQCADELEDLL